MIGWVSVAGFAVIMLAVLAGGVVHLIEYRRERARVISALERGPVIAQAVFALSRTDYQYFPRWASALAGVGVIVWLGGAVVALLAG